MPADKLQTIQADRTFAFGGGGGRISDEAWRELYNIWRFEYMGAAEFEHGAVPDAIVKMIDEPTLVTWELKGLKKPIYIIGPATERHEIEERIIACERDAIRLKESTGLRRALNDDPKLPTRTVGWLELDNGFFFTIDFTMRDAYWNFLLEQKEAK